MKEHFYISVVKSVIRIGACCGALLDLEPVATLAVGFAAAEILGIAEELYVKPDKHSDTINE